MPGLYPNTGFTENGVDIGSMQFNLVEKSYLIDVYPDLIPTFAQPGLFTWGNNGGGQLGDNTTTNRSSPIQTISGGSNWKQIHSGSNQSAAIKTDGTLWLWGVNSQGELGDNTTTSRSSPVQTVAGGTNWKQVYTRNSNTGAIKTDGTLWMWGYNIEGQIGDNTQTSRSSPVQTVTGGTNWKQVSLTGNFTVAAIKTDGTLWTWGANSQGELGDNTTTKKSSPVQTVAGGTNWKQVSAGSAHIGAIKTDGTLWLWGRNSYGNLGDNTNTAKSSPVQTVAGGTNWRYIDVGNNTTASIKTDGTLWMWGQNTNGQLGDNTTTVKSSPVQTVTGGSNWKQVSTGQHSAAIKTDGTLWMWGRNNYGQLADNTVTNRSSPVQTVTGGNNWKQVAAGNFSTVAIREFGDW